MSNLWPWKKLFFSFTALLLIVATDARAEVISAQQIEADWALQNRLRTQELPITPERDAAGACDGVKNGRWGFHTKREARPWWQVDLGAACNLDHLLVYNRTDIAGRAARLIVLVSRDGKEFEQIHQHDGTVFFGHTDGKPLKITLGGTPARFLRLQLPGTDYFHLDEVEAYALGRDRNIALHKPCTQSSVSQWSGGDAPKNTGARSLNTTIRRGLDLADCLQPVDSGDFLEIARQVADVASDDKKELEALEVRAHWAVRRMALANPLLDFDSILFVKRAPATLPHISDQYYGWWSRPGGGIYILENFKSDTPQLRCLTDGWPEGSFLRPDLSCDDKRVLFAYCRYYPHVSEMEKVDKTKLPADAFYQIYEMNIDGTDVRQLTRGRYDDFDARYLPDGEIVFLSTRKGTFLQCTTANTAA
ncbi:MAG: discoidin domain-containing protein, partial [Planctomycetota bacterium]